MQEEFECFWLDVVDYAQELNLDTSYVEEEFVIEGELIKVKPPVTNEFINQLIDDMDMDDIITWTDVNNKKNK